MEMRKDSCFVRDVRGFLGLIKLNPFVFSTVIMLIELCFSSEGG
jgi:hypothetical protein